MSTQPYICTYYTYKLSIYTYILYFFVVVVNTCICFILFAESQTSNNNFIATDKCVFSSLENSFLLFCLCVFDKLSYKFMLIWFVSLLFAFWHFPGAIAYFFCVETRFYQLVVGVEVITRDFCLRALSALPTSFFGSLLPLFCINMCLHVYI